VSTSPAGWPEANRTLWDERVPIHLASDFYDVEGFKRGRGAVEPFEIDELGPLGDLQLAHLQCHFGLDTLDLVRSHPALEAVGLDFSRPAIDAANALAAELGLADRARFVESNVFAATDVLPAGSFDVVYTGKGALIWLPDLRAWAETCARLLRPGGWLYVAEFHPVANCFDEREPTVVADYFSTETHVYDDPGTYADPSAATVHNRRYEWQHPTSRVIEALLGVGFHLQFFHEWDYTVARQFEWLERGKDGRWHWPGGVGLPLMFSLKAHKPGPGSGPAPG
jgi:SAM-dependent methyltransferase